jgi:flagellar motor switch protein FliM
MKLRTLKVPVPQKTLSQSQIDALIAAAGRKVEPFDYRAGKAFDSGAVAEVKNLHKAFATELSQRFSHMLQIPVAVDAEGIDQARFESYVHALPSPTMLGLIALEPGGHLAVTDIANHLGFAMLDLLLGGSGRPAGFRAFTDLEGILLTEVIGHIGWAVRAAFATLVEFEPSIADIQSRPSIGHVSVASDSVLVLSFRIRLDAPHPSEGILSVCYPRHLLEAVLASRQTHAEGETRPARVETMAASVKEASIELKARINGSKLTLGELAMLQPGDVVVLGHATDEPAAVTTGGIDLFEGDVGRYNGRMALRLTKWMAT